MFLEGQALALNWRLEPVGFGSDLVDDLKVHFADLKTPEQITEMMGHLARGLRIHALDVWLDDKEIVFEVQPANTISRIVFKTNTRLFARDLEKIAQTYLGQVDSDQIMAKLRGEILEYLKRRGQFQVGYKLEQKKTGLRTAYQLTIDEGIPCQLSEIVLGFKLPSDLSLGLEKGDYCDMQYIEDQLRKFDDELRKQSYNQRRILSPELRYDLSTNQAVLFLPGVLGQKISYKVLSPVTVLLGQINSIDNAISDPEIMRSELIKNYKAEGYDDVEVSLLKSEFMDGDSLVYIFQVEPGPSYDLKDFEFQGLTVFSQQDAIAAMKFDNYFAAPKLRQEELWLAAEALKQSYAQKGYWDLKVANPRVLKNRALATAKLYISINEGQPRIFNGLNVLDPEYIDPAQILDWLDDPTEGEDPLIFEKVRGLSMLIKNKLNIEGYPYAEVNLILKDQVEVTRILSKIEISISPGRRARFGYVSILGLNQTRALTVMRELKFKEGDLFNPELLEESREALVQLGLFSLVQLRKADDSLLSAQREVVPIIIELRESRPGFVSFGPGWSLIDGFNFAIETGYNNFAGLNRQLIFKTGFNEEASQDAIGAKTLLGHDSSIRYIHPYVLNLPWTQSLSYRTRARAATKRWDFSSEVELSYKHRLSFLKGATVAFFYGFKRNREEAGRLQRENLVATGNMKFGKVGSRLEIDRRDSPAWTTKGFIFGSEFSLARYPLGGDVKFNYADFASTNYYQFYPDWVVSAGLRVSAYTRVGRSKSPYQVLPASERLMAGGAESNRGFTDHSLGPQISYCDSDQDEVFHPTVGGSQRSLLRLELRHKIRDKVAVGIFDDHAAVFFTKDELAEFEKNFADLARSNTNNTPQSRIYDNEDFSLRKLIYHPEYYLNRHYQGVGLFLSYLSPLGAINLSLGFPVRKCASPTGKCEVKRPEGKNYAINIELGGNF